VRPSLLAKQAGMLKSQSRLESHGDPVNGELVMEKKRRKKTGGRVPGSKNRNTLIGKNVSETLKNWLGFDDESVQRTGMIDGKGYGGRLKLEAMWNKDRPIDPQFVALGKFLFAYGYGLPGKATERKEERPPMVFATTHGYQSWDPRAPGAAEMNARSQRMIEAKSEELKVAALEAKGEVIEKIADAEVPETLESVDPDAFGGGGSRR
jgi:hypothetical protein